ncbi:winged helix-turn-helix transcriptional regulator [Candidatus Woesearchaeota archaeon]|nr:winged helix-turn-helix transcriptional regulator [Candidatus Woesearchaeota archaeon]
MEETTLFVKFLGDSPKIRVLDMLITGRELEYSISDIAEQAKIGRATFYRMIDELLKNKIILPAKKFGNMQLYRLNLDNEFIKALIKLYDNMTSLASDKEIKKQKLEKSLVH